MTMTTAAAAPPRRDLLCGPHADRRITEWVTGLERLEHREVTFPSLWNTVASLQFHGKAKLYSHLLFLIPSWKPEVTMTIIHRMHDCLLLKAGGRG
jgi:hypothetical protein